MKELIGIHVRKDGTLLVADKTSGVAGQLKEFQPGEWFVADGKRILK